MKLSGLLFRLGEIKREMELFIIVFWLIFYPDKESFVYFIVFGLLMVLFLLRNIIFSKTINLSPFVYFIFVFNLIFIISIFSSDNFYKSLLMYSDLFLISFYIVFMTADRETLERHLKSFSFLVTLFSLVIILITTLKLYGSTRYFLVNPIHHGVMAGIGVILCLFFLFRKFSWLLLVQMLINCAGVYVSASKGAFLGLFLILVIMAVKKNKMVLPVLLIVLILTLLLPNPIGKMVYFSLKEDPYALNRIDIWEMSWRIYQDNYLTGIGPDGFAAIAKTYNFKQKRGPANYFKIPRKTHNDYIQLIVETGIAGLVFLGILLFILFRKILRVKAYDPAGLLVIYLLFQSCLFNIVFYPVFFLILLVSLKYLFIANDHFITLKPTQKVIIGGLLIFFLVNIYILPYISGLLVKRSQQEKNLISVSGFLQSAAKISPLDYKPHYYQARLHYNYFKKNLNLESFYYSLTSLKKAQQLNKYFIDSYTLESDLFLCLLRSKVSYDSLLAEAVAPLEAAEYLDPFNPFLKLKRAMILWDFNNKAKAKRVALKSLEIEPDFITALFFLQKNFNFLEQKEFVTRVKRIIKKAARRNLNPGTYLYNLYKVPERLRQELELN